MPDMDETLAHYGVKGMRWGHVKSSKPSARPSVDHTRAAKLKNKPLPALSNQQLKDLTTRQNLEQQYKRLNPTTLTKGKVAVQALVGVPITVVGVYNLVKSPAGQATINLGKRGVANAMNDIHKYKAAVGITKAITGR